MYLHTHGKMKDMHIIIVRFVDKKHTLHPEKLSLTQKSNMYNNAAPRKEETNRQEEEDFLIPDFYLPSLHIFI